MGNPPSKTEFEKFNQSMETILRADPKAVKKAMEREKLKNAQKRKVKKQGRKKDE